MTNVRGCLTRLTASRRAVHGRSAAAILVLAALFAAAPAGSTPPSPAGPPWAPDPYTWVSPSNLLSGFPAFHADGTINMVVEIPAGSLQKWEVDPTDGVLRWEFEDGRPRVVRYLAYPANYGMIPRTLLPAELGGDGDPLDVMLLGPAVARGAVVRARPIGVLALLDGGERDDKLIAVRDGTPFGEVRSLKELDERFPGASQILEIWLTSYKGPGKMESRGYHGPEAAWEVLRAASEVFEKSQAD